MNKLTESIIEQATLDWLSELGYTTIAEAIKNNDSEELLSLCRGLSPKAIEIIDRLLQVMVNRRNCRHA